MVMVIRETASTIAARVHSAVAMNECCRPRDRLNLHDAPKIPVYIEALSLVVSGAKKLQTVKNHTNLFYETRQNLQAYITDS